MLKFLRTFAMAAAMMLPFAMQAQNTQTFDFEDNAVPADWTNDATYPWVVTNVKNHTDGGSYCLKSAIEGVNSTTASIEATVTLDAAGTISFYCWASCESATSAWDYGEFYIDGTRMDQFLHVTDWVYKTYELAAGTHTVKWGYRKDSSSQGGDDCFYVDDIVIDIPSCPKVTALTTANATEESISLTWTSDASAFDIYNMTTHSLVGSSNTNSYTVTGLDANTNYTFGVIVDCGGEYSDTVTVSGRTACGATTPLPYSENFSGYTGLPSYPYSGPSVLPACWGYYGNGTNNAETTGSSSYFGGVAQYSSTYSYGCIEANNPYLCMPIQVTGSAVTSSTSIGYQTARGNTRYAVLPAFEDALNTLQISFDYKMYNSYSATGCATTLELGYITTDTSSFVSMQQYQAVTSVQHVVELSLATLAADAPDGARLAFKFSGVHNGTSTYSYTTDYCGIDNILVEEMPSCFHITDLAVSGVTTSSITLTWSDAVNSGATYSVYTVTPTDTTLVEGGISNTTYTVENLDPNTQYVFSVVANCSASDASEGEMISGRTACVAMTIDADNLFSESFEGTAFPPDCWSTAHTDIASGRTDVWQRQTSTADVHTGSASAKLPDMQIGNKANLVTPLFDIDEANAYVISFWMKRVSSTKPNEGVKVWVNTTPDTIGGTPLMHIRRGFAMGEITETEAGWYKYSAAIPTSGEVYIIFEGISEYGNYSSIDDIAIEVAPSCLPVSGLAVSNIGTDGATLTWEGDADGYTVYDMSDTSVYQYANENTIELYALDPATQYTFGVAANCGGDESDTMLISFRTLCAVVVVDEDNTFRETFNSLTAGIPACWDNSEGTTTTEGYKWNYYSTGHDGAGLRFNSYSNSNNSTNFLATPQMQLDIDARLSFWYKNPNGGDFSVLVSTDGGTTRTTIASGLTGASDWTQFTYDFAADTYTGDTVIVYFKGTSNWGNGDAYIYLDDVTVSKQPSCLAVTDLAVVAAGTTSESITISWVSDGSSFTVLNMADTTEIGSTTDTFMVVNNLTPVTTYTFGVVVDCGSETSDTMYISARTACAPFNAPYTWGFEDMTTSNVPECWNAVSGTPYVTVNSSYSTYSHSGEKALAFYGTGLIVLPELTVEANTLQMQLWLRASSNTSGSGNFEVGYMTDPADATTFTAIATYSYSEFAINGTMTYDMRTVMFDNAPEGARMALRAAPTSTYAYWYVDDVTIDELPSCVPVSNLAAVADQTTTESITLSWVSTGSSFTVLDMADSSIIGTTTDTFMVVNNLEASSPYTFGVVNNCGSGDSDTITVEARTACSAFALPYTEDFENGIDCWSLESCASGTNVVEGTNYAYTGTHAFKFAYNTNPPQYLISPELTGGENGVQVSLMYKTYSSSYPESFVLGYSTTTNETSAFTWLTEQTNLTNTTYEAYTDYMPAGTKYIAVKYTANNQWALYIDSMAISPMSANFCFPVTGLAVDTATGNSVTLSWTGDAASYDVYNGTALVGSTTDTFYTVSGLTASTAYTFGVQAICSASDSSDMVTIAAMTDCENGSCTITIVGTDEYGDGWDNSYIDIQQNGVSVGQCTVEGDPWAYDDPYPVTETYTYTVCAGVPVTFTWVNGGGNYDDEASFVIKNGNDSVIYTASDASELTAGSVFYTANNVCGSDEPQPQVEEATIAASAVTYWVGTGNNQVVMAINWADTALAWGVNFSTDSITSQDVLDIIAANDPRFSWDTGSYGLGNITFTENGTTHTGDATHFWESKRNTISDMGLYQNLGNGDFQKWANSAAGVVVDSMEYSGVWYYMYNYPMTIYPVTAPQPGPQPADSISVTYTVNDAVMGSITPNGTIRQAVGDSLIATATANNGYRLQGWRLTIMAGGQVASDTTFSLVQPSVFFGTIPQSFATYGASVTVTAIFEAGAPDSVEVTYTVNDATMGSINPSGTVMTAVGTQISATATANEGYELYGWVLTVMLDDQVVDSDTTMTNETSHVFGSLPQTFADYNATVIITALFQQQVGIEDADIDNVNAYSANSTIYVRGAEGKSVYVFDVNGRMLNHEAKASENCDFRMENTGVYLVKVGNAAAQRVLVVR